MKTRTNLCWRCACFCGDCVACFCIWSLWLVLAVVLAFQLYIAFAHELAVPSFLVRSLESRLAVSGLHTSFGRARFDPSGRVLLENARVSFVAEDEPAVTAQRLYIDIDPWSLLAGRFEPRQLQASGVSLWVPAMLSATGRSENLLQDVELSVTPAGEGFEIHQLTARLAGMPVTGRGTVSLAGLPHHPTAGLPLAELLATYYQSACRQLTALSERLTVLQSPSVNLTFRASHTRGAIAQVTLLADGLRLAEPVAVTAGPLRLATRLPLWGTGPIYARIAATADSLQLPHEVKVDHLHAVVRAQVSLAEHAFHLRRSEVQFARLSTPDVTVHDAAVHLVNAAPHHWQLEAAVRLGHEPVGLTASVDPVLRSARVHAIGKFDPALMAVINRHAKRDIRPFLDFANPPEFDLHANFAPGARFTNVEGRVFATQVLAHNVTFDRIGGHVVFDGKRFIATNAEAHVGENFARGTYEQDVATHQFRFLLKGRLRPLDISGWFREWWPNFWDHFDFTAAPPDAEVDVQGRWGFGQGWRTSVFVFADSRRPMIRGVQLDHALTLIYLRPHYYDGMEIFATKGGGSAHGSFVRRLEPEGFTLKRMDFDFDSSLDLPDAAGLVGPEVEKIVAPFAFDHAPNLHVAGYMTGDEDAAQVPMRRIEVSGRATGNFTFHQFPLGNLSFQAVLNGNDLLIEPLSVDFASGISTGRVRIDVTPHHERLGFDLGLKGGNLRQATTILDDYTAQRHGYKPSGTGSYIQHSALVSMDVGLSAEGNLNDPYSYVGTGNAELTGNGLGEIRLLGALSELLNFTSLRFNTLRTDFKLEKTKLVFPQVSITGANSSVSAHGTYYLTNRTLDFNARIYPFEESKFILKNVVGAVLSPLSTVLAVKLTGRIEKPSWSFVIGPTNFLRNLTQSAEDKPAPGPTAPTPPAAPPSSPPASTSPNMQHP